MDRSQKAVTLFQQGFNCAQAVLEVFAETAGLQEQNAAKLASGFGGGIGRTGQICGALSGAIMALGLKYGSTNPQDKAAKNAMYRKTAALMEDFKQRTGSLYCRDLLGFDLSSEAGRIAAAQPGAFEPCPEFVRVAAEITEQMLSD